MSAATVEADPAAVADGGAAGNLFFGGDPGLGRLFGASMGTEVSWLLPAALIGLVAGLWFTRRTARTDRCAGRLLLWGGWLLVTGAVFSFMDGTIHPTTRSRWPRRSPRWSASRCASCGGAGSSGPRIGPGGDVAATGVWAFILLDRTPDWLPWLRWVVLVGTVVVAAVLAAGVHRLGRATAIVAAGRCFSAPPAPAAYAIETTMPRAQWADRHVGARKRRHRMVPAAPGFRVARAVPAGPCRTTPHCRSWSRMPTTAGRQQRIGSMTASSLELKTGASVMAIGGFTGGDNSPTLEQFQAYVTTVRCGTSSRADGGRPAP